MPISDEFDDFGRRVRPDGPFRESGAGLVARVGRLEEQIRELARLGAEGNRLQAESAAALRQLCEDLDRRVEVLADRLNAGKPGFDFPWPPVPRENEIEWPVAEHISGPPTVRDLERDTEDRLAENAVLWPISKRRWLNERADSREGDSYVFDHVDNDTGRPMFRELDSDETVEQPVTEEAAKRAQRLNDILLNIALAAERHHAIGLSTSDTQILNDYLDGLDPHCAVDSRDED